METTGTQSRREGESYAEWMARLYPTISKASNLNGANELVDPELKRPMWGDRVPVPLSWQAHEYMRANNMTIPTFLKVAIHEYLNSTETSNNNTNA